jgi:hypothetical protein
MSLPTHWDDKHLLSFLYIYIAQSDFILTGEEAEMVKRNLEELLLGRFGLSTLEKDTVVSEVKEAEALMSESEKMDTIQVLSEKIDLDWDTYQYVIQEMDEIAHSDKYVSVEEHSVMYFVRLKFNRNYPNHTSLS